VTHDGGRFLASVCGDDIEPIKELILKAEANEHCRGQAVMALGLLVAWGERSREELESYFLFLAREGLPRQANQVWNNLAAICTSLEFLSVFPELRRAYQEGLINRELVRAEDWDEVERAPRGELSKAFAVRHPPIKDVVNETRWWAGFQRGPGPSPAQAAAVGAKNLIDSSHPYVAPDKVGRNDLCPCGSGKKFKKCCGQS
jgi:hypothetical protein